MELDFYKATLGVSFHLCLMPFVGKRLKTADLKNLKY